MSDKSDTPRTGLGEALEALRSKALAKGMRTLSMDEIEACLGGYYELQSELSEKDAALRKSEAELSALKSRLEVDPRHSYDGIACRDETIKLQDEEIERLKAELFGVKEYRDKNPLGGPAKRFDAVADGIRAGMDYKAAMEDFGLAEKSECERLKAERDSNREDAERFRYLQSLPVVIAQQFFWNYGSRKQRVEAIDAARKP